jgi:hypothetical protein
VRPLLARTMVPLQGAITASDADSTSRPDIGTQTETRASADWPDPKPRPRPPIQDLETKASSDWPDTEPQPDPPPSGDDLSTGVVGF